MLLTAVCPNEVTGWNTVRSSVPPYEQPRDFERCAGRICVVHLVSGSEVVWTVAAIALPPGSKSRRGGRFIRKAAHQLPGAMNRGAQKDETPCLAL
jgi:hypothetical protein